MTTPKPVAFWQAPSLIALPWLTHGVTERCGGASSEPFATLNLGLHVGDEPGRVVENRRRAAHALGFALETMVCAGQIHGGCVARVTLAEAGRGAEAHADALPGVDALITDMPGVLLALFFADCVPVLLADPKRRAIGVAHAGWRGLAAGVLPQTIRVMQETFDTQPHDLIAAIGPCIGACCYEVGGEVAAFFADDVQPLVSFDGRPHVDLAGVTYRQLRAAGVRHDQITTSGHCTSCLPNAYFSHRRDRGETGRMGALIGITDIRRA